MGRIQTNIGLITGIPIMDTVDSLIALAARPRDMLVGRTNLLQEERIAVTELSALLAAVRYITESLGKANLYEQLKVTSSDPASLAATMTGKPPKGTYQFTPLRTVQAQQWLSSGFKSDTDPIGGGKFSFRFGDHVQRSAELDLFGGGQGVVRGQIRITDRSGARADVDLSTVQTVDDVLEAINAATAINVTAVAHGDGIRLIDHTGQTVSNLKVQDIGGGTTAASLGLGNVDVADDVADGEDMLWLYEGLELDVLNDGSGVRISSALPDIEFTLRDGTEGTIDFSPIETDTSNVLEDITLGDLLERINSVAPGQLEAEIAPDGDRLVLRDLTEGEAAFTLAPAFDTPVLVDLGLDGSEAVDGVITGRRILGGAKTVLLSSLNGGRGFGELGAVELTDRSGASDTVDLSAAETLEDVIDAINAADVGIVAQVSRARNGIELVDTTGAYAGNLIVANADATATADKLGIDVDDDVSAHNSGDMHLQVVAHNTRLADLNGGNGIAQGNFTIVDSRGQRQRLSVSKENIETVGDLIREIDRLGLAVYAEINLTGDGIRIVDTGGGAGTLTVEEGNSTTAADLHLLAEAEDVEIDGETTQVIDGSTTCTIELDEKDSLSDLRRKIADLGAGVSAMTFVDEGASRPFRLSLVSDRPGKGGELVVDTSEVDFSMEETVRAQNALLLFGEADMAASGVLVSSSSNVFRSVLSGVNLEIKQASDQPVTVTVSSTDANLITNVRTMVDNYNKFRDKLAELTAYNAETDIRSVLTGDATALRLDTDLSSLLSGSFAGAGPIKSLAEVGVSFESDGTLKFDESALKAKFAADPAAVEQFCTADELGLSDKLTRLIDELSDEDTSLLAGRLDTLKDKVARNQQRIAFMDERLDAQRERMLLQFYRMELAIGKMQTSLSSLEAIQPLPPITTVSRAR